MNTTRRWGYLALLLTISACDDGGSAGRDTGGDTPGVDTLDDIFVDIGNYPECTPLTREEEDLTVDAPSDGATVTAVSGGSVTFSDDAVLDTGLTEANLLPLVGHEVEVQRRTIRIVDGQDVLAIFVSFSESQVEALFATDITFEPACRVVMNHRDPDCPDITFERRSIVGADASGASMSIGPGEVGQLVANSTAWEFHNARIFQRGPGPGAVQCSDAWPYADIAYGVRVADSSR